MPGQAQNQGKFTRLSQQDTAFDGVTCGESGSFGDQRYQGGRDDNDQQGKHRGLQPEYPG